MIRLSGSEQFVPLSPLGSSMTPRYDSIEYSEPTFIQQRVLKSDVQLVAGHFSHPNSLEESPVSSRTRKYKKKNSEPLKVALRPKLSMPVPSKSALKSNLEPLTQKQRDQVEYAQCFMREHLSFLRDSRLDIM